MPKRKKAEAVNDLNLVPMIDVTSFILLSLAILTMSMKKEASLDNILQLPPVLRASKQDTTQLQIYILPARILPGGFIDPDSTGLVAFTGKGGVPFKCPSCSTSIRSEDAEYVPNSLREQGGDVIATMKMDSEKDNTLGSGADSAAMNTRPPAYFCMKCNGEISPYLKLDEVPKVLKVKKKEIVDLMVATENGARTRMKLPPMTEAEVKELDGRIPLMIKADDKAFYGRIIQVVNMVKSDEEVNIKKFAFVTLASASLEAQKKDVMTEKTKGESKDGAK